MISDLSQSTNCPQLWNEIGLDQKYHALWHINWPDSNYLWPNPLKYIKSTDSYRTAKKIFIVGQEGAAATYMKFDARFHVWEPILGIDHDRYQPYLFWFDWTKIVANDMDAINRLSYDESAIRPYYFDCLLGKTRTHRDFIFDKAKSSDRILLTYQDQRSWVPGSDLDPNIEHVDSQMEIYYKNKVGCNLSVIIPWKIYNRSWFTIVAESYTDKIFLTEKTAKPLLSRRLFVWFGAKHGLKQLRKLGFVTFDNVIDESYDDIDDDLLRWNKAWEQVEYLMLQDPKVINEKIVERLIHNQQKMINTDHYKILIDQIKSHREDSAQPNGVRIT